jgi:TupA-like ATPgrasp
VKATHLSGAVVVVSHTADPDVELPHPPAGWPRLLLRPERLDWRLLQGLAAEWLEARYSPAEWAYRKVPPRLLAEELPIEDGDVPPDHRVFVFHGRGRLIQVDMGRFVRHTQAFYTPQWERLEAQFGYPRGPDVPRPPRLVDMLEAAEALGRETDFVRVDFDSLGSRLVIGELTNYPMAGGPHLSPAHVNRLLGDWWTLPRRYSPQWERLEARARLDDSRAHAS